MLFLHRQRPYTIYTVYRMPYTVHPPPIGGEAMNCELLKKFSMNRCSFCFFFLSTRVCVVCLCNMYVRIHSRRAAFINNYFVVLAASCVEWFFLSPPDTPVGGVLEWGDWEAPAFRGLCVTGVGMSGWSCDTDTQSRRHSRLSPGWAL